MATITQEMINESQQNTIDNGYDLLPWSDEEIANDMADYDATFEGIEPKELIPFIKIWRQNYLDKQKNGQ